MVKTKIIIKNTKNNKIIREERNYDKNEFKYAFSGIKSKQQNYRN